jgi:hypothetical protein
MKCTKIFTLLIVVFVSLSIGAMALVATASSQVLWGDVDSDGNFDSDDYALMRQYLLGMIGKDKVAATADVDGDGKLTSDDYAHMKRHLLGIISVFPVEEIQITPTPTSNKKGSLTLSVDKDLADQGDIVIASLNIKDINDFAGYQANIKYDPTVLQPIIPFGDDYLPYGNLTPAEPGTLLANAEFKPVDVVFHDTDIGILSFGRSYLKLDSYRNSGKIETTGSIGIIRFRVLRAIPTKIYFKGTNILPTGINGTALYDSNANQIMSYDIIQPDVIFGPSIPSPTPVPTPTPKLGAFSLAVDKSTSSVGDIITATLSINDVPNFSGYQATLKYDPASLQPVYADGTPYDKTSSPETGTLLCNRYSPADLASNNLESGILNFGRAYIALSTYRNSKTPESSGTLAIVHFKVLKSYTKPALVDNPLLDNDLDGTLVFDWNGSLVKNYNVMQN